MSPFTARDVRARKPSPSGYHGVFAAFVLADDKGLQQSMRRDGCGEFGDGFVRIGLADIAVPGESLLSAMVVVVMLSSLV